eukprot:TRINITY_DN72216_c0_g1_i1.p1 TRINITY_DN72216_c0_g1~~TRINITY_DN72216_c0_g1_i1.p1  ORF type:complete len:1544 (-),score=413.28 TRINITY_DN72216_c0_g1_i1:49-4611(-)
MAMVATGRSTGTAGAAATASSGVSGSTSAATAKRKQASVVEMLDYVKSLDIDPIKEADMLWIAEEAFNASLPPAWTEHQDEQGRIYFHNTATGESTWRHPMDDLFKEIVEYQRRVVNTGGFWQVEDEIAEQEELIRRDLADWMELFAENGEKFFYNKQTEESRFDDPRMAVYHHLYARIKMVAKMKERFPILARAPRPDEPTQAEKDLMRKRENEQTRFVNSVVMIQSAIRVMLAKRRVRAARAQAVVQKGPQPLRGKVRLRLQKLGPGGGKELCLSLTTPHKRHRAATKVQARMRGVLTRKKYRPLVQHRCFLSKEVTKIQTMARIWLARRRVARKRVEKLHKGATKIQKVWRGYRDRQYVTGLRSEKARFDWIVKSITKIQSGVRMALAVREKNRLKLISFTASTSVIQRMARVYIARLQFQKAQLVEQPVQFFFLKTEEAKAKTVMPFSWQMWAAPWLDEEKEKGWKAGEGEGFVNVFQKTGINSYKEVAAAKTQSVGRGFLGRRRAKLLWEVGNGMVDKIWHSTCQEIDFRAHSAVKMQAMFRGLLTRKKNLIFEKKNEYLKKSLPQILQVQAYLRRYCAQEWMVISLAKDKNNSTATVIQAAWRGWLARRHVERLREEALWPVKGWFDYVATGRDAVQVEVCFLGNPSFDDYKYFVQHGSNAALQISLQDLEHELASCMNTLGAIELDQAFSAVDHIFDRPESAASESAPSQILSKGNHSATASDVPGSSSSRKGGSKEIPSARASEGGGSKQSRLAPPQRKLSSASKASDTQKTRERAESVASETAPERGKSLLGKPKARPASKEGSEAAPPSEAGSKVSTTKTAQDRPPSSASQKPAASEAAKAKPAPPEVAEVAPKSAPKAAPKSASKPKSAPEAPPEAAAEEQQQSLPVVEQKPPAPAAPKSTPKKAAAKGPPKNADVSAKEVQLEQQEPAPGPAQPKQGEKNAKAQPPSKAEEAKASAPVQAPVEKEQVDQRAPTPDSIQSGRQGSASGSSRPEQEQSRAQEPRLEALPLPSVHDTIVEEPSTMTMSEPSMHRTPKKHGGSRPKKHEAPQNPLSPSAALDFLKRAEGMYAPHDERPIIPRPFPAHPKPPATNPHSSAKDLHASNSANSLRQSQSTGALPPKDDANRRNYAGTLKDGKFERTKVESIDAMSSADKAAILADIDAERQRKMAEIAEKSKKHKKNNKEREQARQDNFKSQMSEAEALEEERRRKKVKELKKWLKQKEADDRAKKERDTVMMQEVMEKENAKAEASRRAEAERLEQREKRLRAAERQKAKLESQLLASREAAQMETAAQQLPPEMTDPRMQGQQMMQQMLLQQQQSRDQHQQFSQQPLLQPGYPMTQMQQMPQMPQQRVVHRHIHHHVHYHEGEGEAEQGSLDDRRRIEQVSEDRVRQQLEQQDAMGMGMHSASAGNLRSGLPRVDPAAETPTMMRAASMGAMQGGWGGDDGMGMTQTQKAFRQGPLPQLDAQELGRRHGVPSYGKNVQKAIGSYADSGRPRFVKQGMAPAPLR